MIHEVVEDIKGGNDIIGLITLNCLIKIGKDIVIEEHDTILFLPIRAFCEPDNEVGSRFDAMNGPSFRAGQGPAPPAVMSGEVEHAGLTDLVGIGLDHESAAQVQTVPAAIGSPIVWNAADQIKYAIALL
ncbi:MAG: hypothetical protein AAGA26_10125 [Pseudomonadota bacterium]